ncbi:MAG TPA: hypothetical protein VNM69_15330 [Bacillus sp. (in: firmicutes)]|nr:hypothetical protein [Bacillus sp. (in: firmicutes)]
MGCLAWGGYLIFLIIVADFIANTLQLPSFFAVTVPFLVPLFTYNLYRMIKIKKNGCITYATTRHSHGVEGLKRDEEVKVYLYQDRLSFNNIQFIPLERVKLAKYLISGSLSHTTTQIGGGRKQHFKHSEDLIINFINKEGTKSSILLSRKEIPFSRDLKNLTKMINDKIGKKDEKPAVEEKQSKTPYEL